MTKYFSVITTPAGAKGPKPEPNQALGFQKPGAGFLFASSSKMPTRIEIRITANTGIQKTKAPQNSKNYQKGSVILQCNEGFKRNQNLKRQEARGNKKCSTVHNISELEVYLGEQCEHLLF